MNQFRVPNFFSRSLAAVISLMVAFAVFVSPNVARAVDPVSAISYQGRLLDANGVPVSDSSLEFVFRLFDSPSGGTCLWESDDGAACDDPDETQTVALTDGLFSENIGSSDDPDGLSEAYPVSLDDVFEANADVYLEVEVNGEVLSPRKRIAAAPYALNAQSLDGYNSTDFLQTSGGTANGNFDFSDAVFREESPLVFEGSTDDGFESVFQITDPTADNEILFQDASGTVALLSDIPGGANLWEMGGFATYEDDEDVVIGSSGNETVTDPGFSLSGNDLFVAGDIGTAGRIYANSGLTVNDAGDTGTISVEGTVLDIDSLTFAGAGSLNTTGVGSDLVFSPVDQIILNSGGSIDVRKTLLNSTGNLVVGDTIAPDADNAYSLGLVGSGWSDVYVRNQDDGTTASLSSDGVGETTSGASVIGVYDEFGNSTGGNVQDALDDLDLAIATGGTGSMWTLFGGVIQATNASNDFAIGGAIAADAVFGVDVSTDNVFIGNGSGTDGKLTFKSANGTGADIEYTNDTRWVFGGGDVFVGAADIGDVEAAFVPDGDDIYAAGDIAAQLNMYADAFVAGDASTTFADGSITTAGATDLTLAIAGGDLAFAQNTIVGDGGDTLAIDTSDWDITTTGAMTGIGALTMDGLLTGTAGATVSGAAISLNDNSNFGVNINTGTSAGALALGGGFGTVAVNSSDWDISTAGAATGLASIAGDDNQLTLNTNINVTGADAGSHSIALSIDGNEGVSISATGDGAGGVGARTVQLGVSAAADTVTIGDANANVSVTDADWSVSNAGIASLNSLSVLANGTGLDTNAPGMLNVGDTNATSLSLCESAACDTINVGTGDDADEINIGDLTDVTSLTSYDLYLTAAHSMIMSGNPSSQFVFTNPNATNTSGVFEFDTSSNVTGGFELADYALTMQNGAATGDDYTGLNLLLTANDTDGDMFGLVVQGANTASASAGSYEAGIVVENLDDTAATMTDGVLVRATTDTAVTDAFDASDAEIVNALNVGANNIVGTGAAIDFSEFDVSATTGSITIDDGGNAGQISVEGSTWDINDLTFVGAGTIASAAGADLTLDAASGTVGIATGDGLRLQANTAGDDSVVDSPMLTLRGTYDATAGAGISNTNYDATIRQDMITAGAVPTSQIAFNIGGGADEMQLTELGKLTAIGGTRFGDTTGNDDFQFTSVISTSDAFQLTADSVSTADVMQISADGLTTGRGIYLERVDNGTNFTGTDGLLTVNMLDTGSSGRAAIFSNSGTGSALFIDQNGNTGSTINTTTGGALHIDNTSNADYGLTVYSNNGTTTSNLAEFFNDNTSFDNYVVEIRSDATDAGTANGSALHIVQNEVDAPGANAVGTQALVIDTNENFGAADGLQSDAMILVREDVTGTPDTVFRVDADGDIWADGTLGSGAADVAEIYPSTDSLSPGELVAFDPAGDGGVVRATSAYQGTLMGAVSTMPGVLLGFDGDGYKIALRGRIPLLVSDENGPIAVGDAITSSSHSGYGMKATEPGQIVGYALESFDDAGTGTISVSVNPGFFAGNVIGTDGSATVLSDSLTLEASGTATATTTGVGSETLSLRGSGWNGSEATPAQMSLVTDVTDAADYRLSIENTLGTQVAYVSADGDLALAGKIYPSDRGTLQTSKYLFYDGSAGAGGDFMRTNASGWATGSYDFAEMFPSSDALEAGDLVVFASQDEHVARSTVSGDERLAGIVSTRPGFLAGENLAGQYPIALAGRVPTKVTLENGPIQVGDPLTSSSKDGYAMKAVDSGVIVGYALEPYAGSSAEDDKIIAFVSVGYWNGASVSALPGTSNQASGIAATEQTGGLSALNLDGTVYAGGNDILNVRRIAGISDRWSIGEDGLLATSGLIQTTIESYQGDMVTTTAVTSPDVQITLTGTGTLEDGEAVIRFEDVSPEFNDVISTTAPIRVVVTPNGPVSLYVFEKNNDGFGVRQVSGNETGITFDWMVSAYRTDYEPDEDQADSPDDTATSGISIAEPDAVSTENAMDSEQDTQTAGDSQTTADEQTTDPLPSMTEDTSDSVEPASPESPDIPSGDSMESTSVEPAPLVLPADDAL